MATPHEEMAQLIFDVLSGKGHEIYMYDEKGNQVFDPKKSDRLWSNNEKLMVSLGYTKGKPPKPLVTFYTSDVTDKKRFKDIKFALKRHNPWDFSFDTEHFARTLEPRHFKHMNVTETHSWSGSTRTSYFPINGVLVVIKHSRPWHKDNLDQAQRWRRIKQVMLHTPTGERFKFPLNHVLGAKAMAQHLSQQKSMHDPEGTLIQDLTKSLQNMSALQRRARRLGSTNLLNEISTTRGQIKKLLGQMAETRSYNEGVSKARKMLTDWKQPTKSLPLTFREAKDMMGWLESFDLQISENEAKTDQVKAAWVASDGNKYQTLDYLKRNVPGWESRFEADPSAVTAELDEIIEQLKKSEK